MSYERRVTSDAYSPFTTDEVLQNKTEVLIWQLGISLAPKPIHAQQFLATRSGLQGHRRLNQSPLAMCFESGDHEYWVASSSAPNKANNLR